MKVLHVIETLGIGGAERLLVTLLPELKRQEIDVTLAVLRSPFDLRPVLEEAGVTVIELPRSHKWNLLGGARNIARLARERNCTLIHAHLYFPAVCTALARVLRLSSAATVITFHNLAYTVGVNKAGIALRLKKALAAWLYPNGFDARIGVSSAVAEHYAEKLGLKGIEVIHNPVDLQAIGRLGLKARNAGTPSALHLVLPGRLVHEKGHADFLQALICLREQGYSFRATLAGDGPMRGSIETTVHDLALADCVSITGLLTHAQMLEVIAGADIVVVPSRSEGFGLTALEAMALGRPVLASRAGGLPEVLGDAGVLVPVADPAALAGALALLLNDAPRRAALGQAGRVRSAQFSLPVIAERLINIYRRLVPSQDLVEKTS